MRTYLDCIPCFFKQALKAARISGADLEIQKEILCHLSQLVPDFSYDTSPVEMGRVIYTMISKATGKKDPYKETKEENNRLALKIYPELKKKVKESNNPLLAAVMLAIKGNLIDFNLKDSQEISSKIDRIANYNFDLEVICSNKHFDYQYFYQSLLKSKYILYLADNAGEVVFDRILIEQLVDDYKKDILYVVKGKPALNNALVDDAIYCGINSIAKIISCGADCPGVLLEECSSEFMRLFEEAEMIISKGWVIMRHYLEESSPIFFY